MFLLGLILILVLHLEGVSGDDSVSLYHSSGQNVTLVCAQLSHFGPTCSGINWLFNKDVTHTFEEVKNGKVSLSSQRAARLHVDKDCSLIISNITDEDAGYYTCRVGDRDSSDKRVYVSVLTISTSPSDADPVRDSEVVLECSLVRSTDLRLCAENTVLWQDEGGRVLLDKGDGYEFLRRTNCVSLLKVKRQSDRNRKYTCKVTDDKNNQLISADYTPIFTDTEKLHPSPNIVCSQEEPEEGLTYITYTDNNKKASPRLQVTEEEVTYSAVKRSS
ncbi:uncharacterized protein LOC117502956 [Thalassophryne amazonica]|uniref:uncharacterized protein LOC117502956 n=1 Tax=Thalassophryne amazonica TaxID=390379 RepID=UPI0014715741|nr:uncharacterized protein LOC117502956 [Thalassophryne amazonica]